MPDPDAVERALNAVDNGSALSHADAAVLARALRDARDTSPTMQRLMAQLVDARREVAQLKAAQP